LYHVNLAADRAALIIFEYWTAKSVTCLFNASQFKTRIQEFAKTSSTFCFSLVLGAGTNSGTGPTGAAGSC